MRFDIYYKLGPYWRDDGSQEFFHAHYFTEAETEMDALLNLESTMLTRDFMKMHVYWVRPVEERSHE